MESDAVGARGARERAKSGTQTRVACLGLSCLAALPGLDPPLPQSLSEVEPTPQVLSAFTVRVQVAGAAGATATVTATATASASENMHLHLPSPAQLSSFPRDGLALLCSALCSFHLVILRFHRKHKHSYNPVMPTRLDSTQLNPTQPTSQDTAASPHSQPSTHLQGYWFTSPCPCRSASNLPVQGHAMECMECMA